MSKQVEQQIDKLAIGFLADILYCKELLCYEEYEDILDAKNASDLESIVEKMLRGEYNVYRKGETYANYRS